MAKILLVTNIFPPLIGGPATFIDRLARKLSARGHKVTVVCSGEGSVPKAYDADRAFTIHRVDVGNRYLYEIKIRLVLAYQLLSHRIILVNGLASYVVPLARVLKRSFVLKVVGDSVWEQGRNWGIVSEGFEAFQEKSVTGNVPRKLDSLLSLRHKMLQAASLVVVPGPWLSRIVASWGVDESKLRVLENGVPLDAFVAHKPVACKSGAALQIVFIGRLTNWKGVETLLLALQGQQGMALTVVGDGPELPMLQALADQLGVRESVSFVGKLEQAELHERMKSWHVLALPSAYEGLSHTLLEAGAAGLARVVSTIGGNTDVVSHKIDGLCVPYGDVAAWRAALASLRDDDELRLRLASVGQLAARKFDFDETVSSYCALLETQGDAMQQVETKENVIMVANAGKVVHLMPFYDAPGRVAFSGAENHLLTLMQGQVQAGWDVELIMVVGLDGQRLHDKADELRAKGIKVTMVLYPAQGLGLKNKLLRPLILTRLIALLKTRRDAVVHCHPVTGSGGMIPLAAWLAGCPNRVVSYHNNQPFLLDFPYKQGMQAIDKITKRTIAISGSVHDHLVKGVGLHPTRTKIVYYGVEVPTGHSDKAALRARLGVAPDAFLVGLVGRLTPQKDIPTFLKALKQMPKVQGIIIGGGELEASLKAEAQSLGLTNIIFAGPQPDGPELIGCLDLMVLPSSFEGLGLVLLEAMVRHVPIVGSTGGAIPEITEQGKLARLFPVGEVQKLVEAIEGLRTDEAARKALADAAYARACEKYTVPAMVANTARVYEEATQAAAG